MSYLLYHLIPAAPNTIKLAKFRDAQGRMTEGFSSCDEYGRAFWLPYDTMKFKAFDQDTIDSFLGETSEKDGYTYLHVFIDVTVDKDLDMLRIKLPIKEN